MTKYIQHHPIIKFLILAVSITFFTACNSGKSEQELYKTCSAGLVCIEHSFYYEIRIGDAFILFSTSTNKFYNPAGKVDKATTYGTGALVSNDTILTSRSVVTAPPLNRQKIRDVLLTDFKASVEWLKLSVNINFSLSEYAKLQQLNQAIKALETGKWEIIPHSEYRAKHMHPETHNQIFASVELLDDSSDLPYAKLHMYEDIPDTYIFPLAAQADHSNPVLKQIKKLFEGEQELYIIGYEGVTDLNAQLPMPTMSTKFEDKSIDELYIPLPSGEAKGRNGNLIINQEGELVGIINESQEGAQGINLEALDVNITQEEDKN